MVIIFLMLGGFALVFAALVRQSDALSVRPQYKFSRCEASISTPCIVNRML